MLAPITPVTTDPEPTVNAKRVAAFKAEFDAAVTVFKDAVDAAAVNLFAGQLSDEPSVAWTPTFRVFRNEPGVADAETYYQTERYDDDRHAQLMFRHEGLACKVTRVQVGVPQHPFDAGEHVSAFVQVNDGPVRHAPVGILSRGDHNRHQIWALDEADLLSFGRPLMGDFYRARNEDEVILKVGVVTDLHASTYWIDMGDLAFDEFESCKDAGVESS